MNIKGILLLYHHPLAANAPTIMEHVDAFEQHSRFRIFKVNTELGFPAALADMSFEIIVLHYSLFALLPFYLNRHFLSYIKKSTACKVAFFQDEHRYCPQRFDFINSHGIDCIYTLVEPDYFAATYQKYTRVQKIIYTLPGYVSDALINNAAAMTRPWKTRTVDIGYRARQLPVHMGEGAQEKHLIGQRVNELARGCGLRLDIATEEHHRIYGDAWFQFLSNCRAVLGVEAGATIFDLDDRVYDAYSLLVEAGHSPASQAAYNAIAGSCEGSVYYRTISPRHFEAAAFRVVQILFEGNYSGIMQPMVHYIPLKKDFSNFQSVMEMLQDETLCQVLTETAHADMIAAGRYSYQNFIAAFDDGLERAGLFPCPDSRDTARIAQLLERGMRFRKIRERWRSLLHRPFPGRRALGLALKPALKKIGLYVERP